jgi:hypothetical protein
VSLNRRIPRQPGDPRPAMTAMCPWRRHQSEGASGPGGRVNCRCFSPGIGIMQPGFSLAAVCNLRRRGLLPRPPSLVDYRRRSGFSRRFTSFRGERRQAGECLRIKTTPALPKRAVFSGTFSAAHDDLGPWRCWETAPGVSSRAAVYQLSPRGPRGLMVEARFGGEYDLGPQQSVPRS